MSSRETWLSACVGLMMTGPMLAFGGLWAVPYLSSVHGLPRETAAATASLLFVGWGIGAPPRGPAHWPAIVAERKAAIEEWGKHTTSPALGAVPDAIDDPAIRVDAATKIARGEVTGDDAKALLTKLAAAERHGGRRPLPAPVRATGRLERSFAHAAEAGDFAAAELRRIPADDRPQLAARLDELGQKLRDLARRLRR